MNGLVVGTNITSRGLAVVLAEDVPAIAKTKTPSDFHLPVS